jgi:hypothetical protein
MSLCRHLAVACLSVNAMLGLVHGLGDPLQWKAAFALACVLPVRSR